MHKGKITVCLLLLILTLACCEKEESKVPEDLVIESEQDFEPSDESIFNVDSKWQDQNADTVTLSFLKGKPTVMAMIYTHCEYSCPKIVADMKEIYSMIPEDKKDEINFLLVSIDPKHDRPDTLKQFMKAKELPERSWDMLTGTETKIRVLAAVLGFKYKKASLMDYAHSNLITVLDSKGVIKHQIEGFGAVKEDLVKKVLKLTKEG